MRKFFSLIAAVLFAGSMMAETYTNTAYADLQTGDIVIITMQKDGNVYAASNGNGTSSAPTAVAVTVADNAITTDATNIIWTVVKDGANITFTTAESKALYCTNSNNGMRVGTNANNVFSIDTESGYLFNNATSRYIGVYNSADWRCYTSVNSNISGQTLAFYAVSGGDVEPTEDYYLTGSIRGWAQTADANYKFVANLATPGEYMLQGITLAAGDELKVIGLVGETLNWYPTGQDNNYVVAAAGTYDIYFRPDGQGGQDWHYGVLYLAEVVPPTAISCADVYEMAKNAEVDLLNDVVVTFANGKNVWVKDETASLLIYFSANVTYAAGDVLSGIAGTVDIYNGVYEIKPTPTQAAAIVATPGAAPAAEAVATVTVADVNKYIVMTGVEFEEDAAFVEGSQSNIVMNGVSVRNQYKNGYAFEAGKKYNVYGVVTIYSNNPQVYFINAEEYDPTAIDNTDAAAKAVKFFENGQLIILKNGVRYNAQGAIVK